MTDRPSDASIAEAFLELSGERFDPDCMCEYCGVIRRARELDAAAPDEDRGAEVERIFDALPIYVRRVAAFMVSGGFGTFAPDWLKCFDDLVAFHQPLAATHPRKSECTFAEVRRIVECFKFIMPQTQKAIGWNDCCESILSRLAALESNGGAK